jgi:excisionase family DNA binding protein
MTAPILRPDFCDTLKLSEFSRTLGISTKTARRWIDSGQIEARKTPGGHYRIPSTELNNRGLTISQFARLVGVHRITVQRWCKAGKIEHSTTPSGRCRIPMSEVPRVGRRRRNR